jgi:hypothetical protein
MEAIDRGSLNELLQRAGLNMADDPDLGVGREMSFAQPAVRTLLVHLGDRAEHVEKILLTILAMEERWLLINRHGSVAQLGIAANAERAAALCFCSTEHDFLARYLCERAMDIGAASVDVYSLGASGNVLLTWDHHTADDGLSVQLRRIEDSNHLLVSLNEIGTEMEILCAAPA